MSQAHKVPTGTAGRRYREITPEAVIFGVLIGVVMNAAITYSGLKIGFTIGGSAIAAVLGWGVLRGVLRKGTIVENNIAQTVASSVNTSNSGVIFTVPVLFLLGAQLDFLWMVAACVAGAVLGVAFIIPTRKQMIDFERLRFPTGTAVAAVLRSPGEGVQKAIVLLAGIGLAMLVYLPTQLPGIGLPGYGHFFGGVLGIPGVDDHSVDVASWIPGWPSTVTFVWAIAPFAIGAGYITGKPGLVVLAGGLLASFVVTPAAYELGWMPGDVTPEGAGGWALVNMNRPLGIGLLMGGAFVGLAVAFPAIGAALKSMRAAGERGGERDELPLSVLGAAMVVAFLVLFFAANATVADGSVLQSVLIAAVGTAWMWFAGIVIAQCTGMTDWSPISGMALLTVMVCLLLTGNQVVPAVLIGAAVCVAITECADMMQDLKTGHLVGGKPVRQQTLELFVVWIGPIVCLLVVLLLAKRNVQEYGIAFGPGTDSPAPQAAALQGAIDGIRGGDAPVPLFAMGGLLGALLSLSGIAGLGVLVGLSMYLPLMYLLPYGLGCLIQMAVSKWKGAVWAESWGVPFAAGLIVGEGLLGVLFAGLQVGGVRIGARAMQRTLGNLLLVLGTILGAIAAVESRKVFATVDLAGEADLSGEFLARDVPLPGADEGAAPLARAGDALEPALAVRLRDAGIEAVRVRRPPRDEEELAVADEALVGRVLAAPVVLPNEEPEEIRRGRILTAGFVERIRAAGLRELAVKDEDGARTVALPPLEAEEEAAAPAEEPSTEPVEEAETPSGYAAEPAEEEAAPDTGVGARLDQDLALPPRLEAGAFLDEPTLERLRAAQVERVSVRVTAPFRFGEWSLRWVFLLAVLITAAGVQVKRSAPLAPVQADGDERTPDAPLLHQLEGLERSVGELAGRVDGMSAAELHRALDPLLTGPIYAFVEAREHLRAQIGLHDYSMVMGPFSSGERLLNRAWSAAVDDAPEESAACVRDAVPHLEAAIEAWPRRA